MSLIIGILNQTGKLEGIEMQNSNLVINVSSPKLNMTKF